MGRVKSYEEVVSAIDRVRDRPAKAESFARFQRALSTYVGKTGLELPADGRGVILVAGTNGKGSVAKTLETLLLAKGEGVGLFTSPHLMETTERIRSFGRDLTKEELVATYLLIEPFAKDLDLSHFEMLTLMMFEVFFGGRIRERVSRAVVEVGVGGRLDPTRCVPHEACAITSIALDHQEILGATIAEIAREKFAIVDSGNLVVHAHLPEEAKAACEARKRETPSQWFEARAIPFRVKPGPTPKWAIETKWGEFDLALMGARAVENTSVALELLAQQGEDVAALLPHLKKVRWPCRMEIFRVGEKRLAFSGDHNVQGAQTLEEILEHFHYDRLQLVVGVGKNKPAGELLEIFSRLPRSRLWLTLTPFRSGELAQYGEWTTSAEGAIPDPVTAVRSALAAAAPNDLVLVTGSLYLVGEMRRQLTLGAFGRFRAEENSDLP